MNTKTAKPQGKAKANSRAKAKQTHSTVTSADQFNTAVGEVTWLATVSPKHKDLPISFIEESVAPAIAVKTYIMDRKGKFPHVFIAWAMVSDEVRDRLREGGKLASVEEWRSGPHVELLTIISPFVSEESVTEQFWSDIRPKLNAQDPSAETHTLQKEITS